MGGVLTPYIYSSSGGTIRVRGGGERGCDWNGCATVPVWMSPLPCPSLLLSPLCLGFVIVGRGHPMGIITVSYYSVCELYFVMRY